MSVGTPDFTRGVVNPQKLLAQLPANTQSVTVGVPPNAETLIVTAWGGLTDYDVTCAGVTSGFQYAGGKVGPTAFQFAGPTYMFDVSAAFDAQVTITFRTAPIVKWAVYSDAGVHCVLDLNKFVDGQGNTYVVSTIPGDGNGDHPTNEASATGAQLASLANLINAPGVGQRIRLFGLQMAVSGAGGVWVAQNGTGSIHYLWCVGSGMAQLSVPPQGLPMPTNDALNFYNWTGGGTLYVSAVYRIETL